MCKMLSRCMVNIVDLRSVIPKTSNQTVYLNACPIVLPIAYPFGLAFDTSADSDIIDISVINIEVEKESIVCKLHLSNTCNAILFVLLGHSKLKEEIVNCLHVHLCEIESCRGLGNVISSTYIPQTY